LKEFYKLWKKKKDERSHPVKKKMEDDMSLQEPRSRPLISLRRLLLADGAGSQSGMEDG
jgi:hypothetical protein